MVTRRRRSLSWLTRYAGPSALLAVLVATAPAADDGAAGGNAETTGQFEGHDRFDDVGTIGELRELERAVVEVTARVRPSVILLRASGGRPSSGTGVIIGSDGLVATCGHVGRTPGRRVTAILPDGTTLSGRTLGQAFDGIVDCGLVQLDTEGRDLPAVPLGTSSTLAAGDWVVALGYTHGEPSAARPALARVGRVLGNDETTLFIDAPIDAGDSGGPSINLRGEVVGLNSRCGRESWQNLATPIDLLNERLERLKAESEPPADADEAAASRRVPRPRYPSDGHDVGKEAIERTVHLGALTRTAEASMLRVFANGAQVARGILIDASGLAVTKASQLEAGARITIETPERTRVAAVEVARDPETDVALLRLDRRSQAGAVRGAGRDRPASAFLGTNREPERRATMQPVRWSVDESIEPGEVVLTPRGVGKGAALGFAAIERVEVEQDSVDGPFLGVQTRASTEDELERAGVDRAVTVVRVVPRTAAETCGLAPDDIVLAVNGQEIGTPTELRSALGRHRPGDEVEISVHDGESVVVRRAVLATRGDAGENVRRGNTATPISRRSSGLGSLLAHDAVTRPEEMGGPIVDSGGRVVGMNIARYDRTATHAISAARMAKICQWLREQAEENEQPDE